MMITKIRKKQSLEGGCASWRSHENKPTRKKEKKNMKEKNDKSMTLLGLAKGKKNTHTKKNIFPTDRFLLFPFFSLLIYISFFIIILRRKKPTVPLHHCIKLYAHCCAIFLLS